MDNGCLHCNPPQAGTAITSLFEWHIADYYDGPIDGVATCKTCNATYAFKMIDWDSGLLARVFYLYPVDRFYYDYIVDYINGDLPIDPHETIVVKNSADLATSFFCYIPIRGYVIESKAVSNEEKTILSHGIGLDSDSPQYDWFAALGLERENVYTKRFSWD